MWSADYPADLHPRAIKYDYNPTNERQIPGFIAFVESKSTKMMTNTLNLFENNYFVYQGYFIDHKMHKIVGRRISKLRDTIFHIINGKPGAALSQDMPEDARLRF